MKQEPFEIKRYLDIMEYPEYADYVDAANAEILRLQGENEALTQQLADAPTWGEWTPITSKEQIVKLPLGVYMFDYGHDNEGNELKIQVSAVKNRNDDGFNWHVVHMDGSYGDRSNYSINAEFESYKLIHAFEKPAREVEPPEKKYNLLGYHVTVAEMAEWRGNPDLNMPNIGELARDLLDLQEKHAAAQAELRELKGK